MLDQGIEGDFILPNSLNLGDLVAQSTLLFNRLGDLNLFDYLSGIESLRLLTLKAMDRRKNTYKIFNETCGIVNTFYVKRRIYFHTLM